MSTTSSNLSLSPVVTTRFQRVLIIGGDAVYSRRIEAALTDGGVRRSGLVIVERLDEGLEQLARGDVDAAILNPRLPDSSSGSAGVSRLRMSDTLTPVVVVSPDRSEAERTLSIEAGAQEYMGFEQLAPQELLGRLADAMSRKRAENRAFKANRALATQLQDQLLELSNVRKALLAERATRQSADSALKQARDQLNEADDLERAFVRLQSHLDQRSRDFSQLTARLLEEIEQRKTLNEENARLRSSGNVAVSEGVQGMRSEAECLQGEVKILRRALSNVAQELHVAKNAESGVRAAWQRRREQYDRDIRELRSKLAEARAARARLESGVTGGGSF